MIRAFSDLGRVGFKEFGTAWGDERPGLRPKTVQLYEGLLRLHLLPTFGNQSALICQHTAAERDRVTAGKLGQLAEEALKAP
ncbi:hypothetical protein [Streptosporangium sp. NPDC048865]|uniref:hypothetical protein n=1 Tax=Streptosporangium sp. NPDC048865 TaxID=3155766 RepID=UPI0034481EA3